MDTSMYAGFRESNATTLSNITVQKNHFQPENEQRALQQMLRPPQISDLNVIKSAWNYMKRQKRSRQPVEDFWEILQKTDTSYLESSAAHKRTSKNCCYVKCKAEHQFVFCFTALSLRKIKVSPCYFFSGCKRKQYSDTNHC